MAITLAAASTRSVGSTAATNSPAIAVLEGDIILAFTAIYNASGSVKFVPPPALNVASTATATAFTLAINNHYSFWVESVLYWARATSAGDVVVEFPTSDSRSNSLSVQAWRGVDQSSPIGALATAQQNTASPLAATVAPAIGDVVLSGLFVRGNASTGAITGTAGFTEAAKLDNPGNTSTPLLLVEYQAAASTTPVQGASTLSSALQSLAYNFVLKQEIVSTATVARGLYL